MSDSTSGYPAFRHRLDDVLRQRDPVALRAFLIAENQWTPETATDPEAAMWMMIATSPALANLRNEARQWLMAHGHAAEAQAIFGANRSSGKPPHRGGRPSGKAPTKGAYGTAKKPGTGHDDKRTRHSGLSDENVLWTRYVVGYDAKARGQTRYHGDWSGPCDQHLASPGVLKGEDR